MLSSAFSCVFFVITPWQVWYNRDFHEFRAFYSTLTMFEAKSLSFTVNSPGKKAFVHGEFWELLTEEANGLKNSINSAWKWVQLEKLNNSTWKLINLTWKWVQLEILNKWECFLADIFSNTISPKYVLDFSSLIPSRSNASIQNRICTHFNIPLRSRPRHQIHPDVLSIKNTKNPSTACHFSIISICLASIKLSFHPISLSTMHSQRNTECK